MMKDAAQSLFSVALELAMRAKDNLPELREGESVKREWLANGAFHRETEFEGYKFISSFNWVTLMTEVISFFAFMLLVITIF